MKAYTTEDGHIVTFRPDLNAERIAEFRQRDWKCRLSQKTVLLKAVVETDQRPMLLMYRLMVQALLYMYVLICSVSNAVIGVKPADEYQFRVFTTPVGPYFKGGAKPITICVSVILTVLHRMRYRPYQSRTELCNEPYMPL